VAVTTALATNSAAKVAAKPATVRRVFKARMTDSHMFYAARCMEKTAGTICAFLCAYTYPVEKLNAT
jgi:hypothetical protein